MADVKISGLPASTTPLAGTEVLPIVQSGVTKQVSVANLTDGRAIAAASAIISANSASDALRITQVGAGNALLVEDSANPDATPFIITNSGNALVGTTATRSVANKFQTSTSAQVFNELSSGDLAGFTTVLNRNDSNGVTFVLGKSRGTAAGAVTTVQNNDNLGLIVFAGADGTTINPIAAQISAEVDGTPGTNDMPGRLVFSTTADGASSPTERMRINAAGNVGIGTSSITGYGLRVGKTADAAAYVGVGSTGSGNSTSTTAIYNFYSIATTTANGAVPYTISSIRHYDATQTTFNADSTVANQYGFIANSSLTGATNNYGFYGNIASGTGRWNFYAAGTAANVFAGTTSIGGLVGAESLRVTPVASAVNYLNVQGAVTTASPSITAAGSDTNIDLALTPKGTGNVRFGTYTAGILAQTGYITIKDAAGNTRNLLVG